jgi:dethiobiotin synthetase
MVLGTIIAAFPLFPVWGKKKLATVWGDALRSRSHADVAQLVEQLIRNEQVAGSSPAIGSRFPSEAMILVLCGTNTGVGKSFIGARLVFALRQAGLEVAVSKPLESGVRETGVPVDAVALREAAGNQMPLDIVCPWPLQPPVSPAAALEAEGRDVSTVELRTAIQRALGDATVGVVETAGGLLSPLTSELRSVDVATLLHAPVLLVAPAALGVVTQVSMALECLAARGIECLAVVLNHVGTERTEDAASNVSWIQRAYPSVTVVETNGADDGLAQLVELIRAQIQLKAVQE